MKPEAVGACMAMGQCISRAGAQHWARLAAERGATPDEIDEMWREWEQLQDEQVQTIHSDPRPDTLCACPHAAAQHHAGTGKCGSCGCTAMRPGGRRWAS